MVAPRKNRRIVCTVIHVPADGILGIDPTNIEAPSNLDSITNSRIADHQRPTQRPSELLPWADPYISGLVTRLQNEVRAERFKPGVPTLKPIDPALSMEPSSELEPAMPTFDSEWPRFDGPRTTSEPRPSEIYDQPSSN